MKTIRWLKNPPELKMPKVMKLNYPRNIPPLTGCYVPRVVLPLKLPKHVEAWGAGSLYENIPFCAGVHYSKKNELYVYLHRLT